MPAGKSCPVNDIGFRTQIHKCRKKISSEKKEEASFLFVLNPNIIPPQRHENSRQNLQTGSEYNALHVYFDAYACHRGCLHKRGNVIGLNKHLHLKVRLEVGKQGGSQCIKGEKRNLLREPRQVNKHKE